MVWYPYWLWLPIHYQPILRYDPAELVYTLADTLSRRFT
jgi:hypothetical protein